MFSFKVFFPHKKIHWADKSISKKDKHAYAAAWGRYVAACVQRRHCGDLGKILSAWQWHLIIETEDRQDFSLPRLAVWEGDTKTVRLFRAPLQRAFPQQPQALALACAHEMFHGLVANSYQNILPPGCAPPPLSFSDEEIAAKAFAQELVTNFRLTLEA
jgi:hypothetical protein